MILADKIIALRKKHTMTQEELADHIGVSRQSISKWEGGLSIPDIEKIIKLSNVFGVSTDFLLDDQFDVDPIQGREEINNDYLVKVEEVHEYLRSKRTYAKGIAQAVSIFFFAGAFLITFTTPLLTNRLSENTSIVIGLVGALLISTWGVVRVLSANKFASDFEEIDSKQFELEYGADGVIKKIKDQYKDTHSRMMTVGIAICILSAAPIFISLIFEGNDYFESIIILSVVATVIIASFGVNLIVKTAIYWDYLNNLLKPRLEREHEVKVDKTTEAFASIYWSLITIVYLAYSFITGNWGLSWLIWPIAGLLFGAIEAIIEVRL